MATKRTGLGRGIGALIPVSDESQDRPVDVFFPTAQQTADELIAVPGARLANLNPLDITPNAQQPRAEFRAEELAELVTSIREVGVLQPIVVRPVKKAGKGAGMFGGAGLTALFALLFVSLAAMWGLGALIGLGWSSLIVAVVYAIVALVLFLRGRKELKSIKGAPKTVDSLKKIPETVTPGGTA